jgi:alpha-tubulin suppressor-like RCC1 family protein
VSGNFSAAIKTDGTLWLWGNGANGRLGNNNVVSLASSPVQTVAQGNTWKQISLGYCHSAAVTFTEL